MAKIAVQHAKQPFEKSNGCWPVETKIEAQRRKCFRRCVILQDR
eukprot:gene6520-6588_t